VNVPVRTLYRASAGSGKTYTLTSAYISLLLDGEHPGSILATTFTRSAAGEILGRVLERLARGVVDDDARDELARATSRTLDSDRCAATLRELIDRFPNLAIQTIDSFFGSVASVFAFELGLPPGWGIVDDEHAALLKAEAIETALERGDRSELVEVIRGLQGESISTNVHATLVSLVDKASDLIAQTRALPELWGALARVGSRLDDERLGIVLADLGSAPTPTLKNGGPSKRWIDARARVLDAGARGDWGSIVGSGLGAKVVDDPVSPVYYSTPIPDALLGPLRRLVDHARAVLVEDHTRRTLAMHDLLDRCERLYTETKRRSGSLTFADPPRLLSEGRVTERLEDMYYRLDARVRHVMLDEFQDTSMAQFSILAPMLDEIMAQDDRDRRLVCVGDPKQSLYSWRGAEPVLMDGVLERYPSLAEEPLSVSYRSAPPVLDAVNAVFGSLASNPAIESSDTGSAAARRWSNYDTHRAKYTDRPGRAELCVVTEGDAGAPPSKRERELAVDRACAQRVGAMLDRDPAMRIGVLVRYTRRIAPLMAALSERGIHASEDRGNPLVDTPSVAAAVSILHAATHPDNTAAWCVGARSPLGAVLGIGPESTRAELEDAARRIRARCDRSGLGAVLADWLDATGGAMDARGAERFGHLVTLAHEIDRSSDAPIEELVRTAQERKYDETDAGAGVKVMTIHGSKGLEFDAVVLPVPEDAWTLGRSEVLVERESELGPIIRITRYPNETMRRIHPDLERIHRAASERMINEELCCLYVAMTRARSDLVMLIPAREPGKSAPSLSAESVVLGALAPDRDEESGEILWSSGRGRPDQGPASAAPAPDDRAVRVSAAPSRRVPVSRLARVTPSGYSRDETRSATHLLGAAASDTAALRLGEHTHAILERLGWIEDWEPDSIETARITLGIDDNDDAWERARAMVRDALDDERVVRVLSRGAWSPHDPRSVRVMTERPFAVRTRIDGVERFIQGRFDRLVVAHEDSRVTRAEVIDYKTDSIGAAPTRDDHGRHAPQMRAYRAAAAALLGIPPDRVSTRIVFLSPPCVVDTNDPA